jgi:endo-alpha-1,4-polygalactosaminidase (GH114 family)
LAVRQGGFRVKLKTNPMTLRIHDPLRLLGCGIALSAILGGTACTGKDNTNGSSDPEGAGLDPTVPPVTSGSWYRPGIDTTWQWQLAGTLNSTYPVEVYDIDLFEHDATEITEFHGAGRRVLCYFSAGSSEDWRPDFARFTSADKGNPLDDWAGEKWLDIRSENVLAVMLDRLDQAKSKGCDGVEPDNVDAYDNDSGFDLTDEDQLGYNRRLANEAHERGLAVALKNDGDQTTDLVAYFDLSLNEQCHENDECDALAPFTAAEKPIFNAEYANDKAAAETLAVTLCPVALADDTRTIILRLELDDSFRVSCD